MFIMHSKIELVSTFHCLKCLCLNKIRNVCINFTFTYSIKYFNSQIVTSSLIYLFDTILCNFWNVLCYFYCMIALTWTTLSTAVYSVQIGRTPNTVNGNRNNYFTHRMTVNKWELNIAVDSVLKVGKYYWERKWTEKFLNWINEQKKKNKK